jgi:methyltransferase (TIGR00027 family)
MTDSSGPALRDISDTARWAAVYRARETERAGALFRDPFARRLAGARGEEIARTLPHQDRHEWAWTIRTFLYDRFIATQVEAGADLIVNLAAGLDARPYRMPLPASLRWVEVDLPGILDYKEGLLEGERPGCALERIRLDLSDGSARRVLFDRLGRSARRALVITEGLLIYLTAEEVGALARDLSSPPSFRRWALDLVSPGLLRMMQRQIGDHLARASAPFRFAPQEGPGFFAPHGWRPAEVRSLLRAAARERRVPLVMRFLALLPESTGRQGSRPWSAVCLLANERE